MKKKTAKTLTTIVAVFLLIVMIAAFVCGLIYA